MRTWPFAFRTLLLLPALLAAGAASGQNAAAPPAAPPPATVTLIACRLEQLQRLLSIQAECGHVEVPEDRSKPAGRKLQLFVARVPAVNRRKQADPLVLLAGGPGLGASVFYPNAAAAFGRIHRDRDILVIDQRGTGRSAPLDCRFDEQLLWDAGDAQAAKAMSECRKLLEQDHDVAQFTTSVAVADLEAVRVALGLGRINLYGGSYGTRVAQHYARRYPQQTRALILDGVVPPELILGPAVPTDAQNALFAVFRRCRETPSCLERYGDPQADYDALQDKLAQQSVPVDLPDPRSGKPVHVEFSPAVFAAVLRLATYSAEQAALLPLALHLANQENYYQPLAAQFLMTTQTLDDVLSYGMHNSVVCTEDVPGFAAAGIDREQLAKTFLGVGQIDALQAICTDWPRGPLDADLHAPLKSDVPALLLSGTADPVTPASYGDQAARGFAHVVHLKLIDQGHGQLGAACIDRLMNEFLDLAARPAEVASLDGSCAQKLRAPPFFLSLSGPAP